MKISPEKLQNVDGPGEAISLICEIMNAVVVFQRDREKAQNLSRMSKKLAREAGEHDLEGMTESRNSLMGWAEKMRDQAEKLRSEAEPVTIGDQKITRVYHLESVLERYITDDWEYLCNLYGWHLSEGPEQD